MIRYELETFPVGAFQCNCTLLMDPEKRNAVVVDPGDEVFKILERIDYHAMTVTAIWHTHAHIDHIGATKAIYELCGKKNQEAGKAAPVIYLHEADRWLYENVGLQAKFLGIGAFDVASSWTPITDGQKYESFDGLKAIHTPGHTPGSCCLKISQNSTLSVPRSYRVGGEDDTPVVILSGDTLFRQSIGRTDLWGGDGAQILKSIKGRLLAGGQEAIVVPGHGPLTTLEQEREKNPFLR